MKEAMTDFATHRTAFHAALVALSDFIRAEDRFAHELDQGRLSFFGTTDPESVAHAKGESTDPSQAARFLEWFGLERPHADGGAAPIHAFVRGGCPGLAQDLQSHARSLCESRVGVYLVKDMDEGGMDLEDAVSGDTLSVQLPAGESSIESGDTLIGRLMPLPGSDQWIASDVTERIPGSALFDSFVEDVEKSKLALGQDELAPLSQVELEVLLGMAMGKGAPAHVAGDAARLQDALSEMLEGIRPDLPNALEMEAALASAEVPGQVIASLLELMAFETDVDIDQLRRLLLELSHAQHANQTASPKTGAKTEIPVSELGGRLVAELEAGEAKGEDLEQLFARLERMVDGESSAPETEGPPPSIEWKTKDEGNLEALMAEYLWERERIGKPLDRESLGRLEAFVRALTPIDVREVEEVDEAAMASILVTPWARGEIQEVQSLMTDLVEWNQWLQSEQDTGFGMGVSDLRQQLIDESRRIANLGTEIAEASSGSKDGSDVSSWHVLKGPDDAWILESAGRRRPWAQDLDFHVGDLILGTLGEDGFEPGFRILPRFLAQALAEDED